MQSIMKALEEAHKNTSKHLNWKSRALLLKCQAQPVKQIFTKSNYTQ